MKKEIGYIVSVLGIFVMAVGFEMIPVGLKFLEGVAGNYIAGAGGVLVVVGVFLSLKGSGGGKRNAGSGEDEVPIYEGVGKKRQVVGYRKR